MNENAVRLITFIIGLTRAMLDSAVNESREDLQTWFIYLTQYRHLVRNSIHINLEWDIEGENNCSPVGPRFDIS